MRSELIITVNPNQVIADDYLQKALETHTKAVGFAVVKDGVVLSDIFTFSDVDLLDAMMKAQELHKDRFRFFSLLELDPKDVENLDAEALQPYPILTRKNKKGEEETIMAAMLDGDFGEYYKSEGNTPAYHLVTDMLGEKIRACYKRNSQDIVKTCEEMTSPLFRKEIRAYLLPRGQITIIPVGFKPFSYSENELVGEYPWGTASKKLGIEPAVTPPVKDTTAETTPLLGTSRPLSWAERKKLAAKKTETPKSAENKQEQKKPHPCISVVKKEGKDVVWVKPDPNNKDSLNGAKQFWKRNTTLALPPHDAPNLLYEGFPASTLRLDSGFLDYAKKMGATIQAEIDQSVFREKMEKAALEKTKKAEAQIETDFSGLLTVDDKKGIVAMLKDTSGGYFHTSWKELEQEMANTPVYSKQIAKDNEELLLAKKKFWFKQEKRALVNRIMELNALLLVKSIAEEKPKAEDEDTLQREAPKKPKAFGKRKAA